jgi:hypothetical protein
MKLYVNSLSKFSGDPIDWEDWETGTTATLGQTRYCTVLENGPAVNDVLAQARNKELAHIFTAAIYQGTAKHILDSVVGEDGHGYWQALKTWFGTDSVSRSIIEHYRGKLHHLQMNIDTSASEYINTFVLCSNKLESKKEGSTAPTKKWDFLNKIKDPEYDVAKESLPSDETANFEDCVTPIRTREQAISQSSTEEAKGKARRVPTDITDSSFSKPNESITKIPSIPNSILYAIKDEDVRRNLIRWRGIYNQEGREIRTDELSGNTSSNADDGGKKRNRGNHRGGGKGSGDKDRNTKLYRGKDKSKKSRRTSTVESGTKSSATVKVRFKEDEEPNDDSGGDEDDDLEDNSGTTLGAPNAKETPARKGKYFLRSHINSSS